MATKFLTRAQARERLGDMPERTFGRLVTEGIPRKGDGTQARFPWPEIHVWLLERERKKARAEAKPVDQSLAESERRESTAKADLVEMKAAQMRGDLMPTELYQRRLEAFMGGFLSTVDGRLGRFERDIVQAGTPAEARKVVEQIRRSLKEGALQFADALEAEPDEEEAA